MQSVRHHKGHEKLNLPVILSLAALHRGVQAWEERRNPLRGAWDAGAEVHPRLSTGEGDFAT